MKILRYFFNFIFISFIAASFSLAWAAGQKLDQIVAIVNDDIITQSDLNRQISQIKQTRAAEINNATSVRQTALDELIDKALEFQIARRMNLVPDDMAVRQSINDIAARNRMSVAQLYQYVVKEGMTSKQFQEMIKKQMSVARLMQQQFGGKVKVTQQEVDAFMKKQPASKAAPVSSEGKTSYHVINLVIPLSESPTPEEITKAKETATQFKHVIEKARSSKDVENFISTHPGIETGDLGWRQLSELPQIFVNYVKDMRPGEIAGPIQTPKGMQLIRLVGMNGANQMGAAPGASGMTPELARQIIYQRKIAEVSKDWLKKAREQSYIKIMSH